MKIKNSPVSWIVFIVTMLGGYIFMIFFMEDITVDLFKIQKKKIHLESTTQTMKNIDKKAEVEIEKSSMNVLIDSTYIENGKKESVRIDSGIPLKGLKYFLVEKYNSSKVTYSIIVTLLMAALGVTIGFITDFILKIIGLDVQKIAHHE